MEISDLIETKARFFQERAKPSETKQNPVEREGK
jgi:hypothetical protein